MRILSTLTLAAAAILVAGCADFNYRYPQGLQWHLENEAHKKALNDQGFPQYTGQGEN
jgi:hypothetical protein